jgi:hypothetical protein
VTKMDKFLAVADQWGSVRQRHWPGRPAETARDEHEGSTGLADAVRERAALAVIRLTGFGNGW